MERSGAALKAAGNTLNESLGLLVSGNLIQQNSEMTAAALRTLSLRIRGKICATFYTSVIKKVAQNGETPGKDNTVGKAIFFILKIESRNDHSFIGNYKTYATILFIQNR